MRPARGLHACAFGCSAADFLARAVPFLEAGLARGEKTLYLAHETPAREVQRRLKDRGVPVNGPRQPGVHVRTCEAAGLARLPFSPARTIGLWEKAADEAVAEGYAGLRAVVEMTWAVYGGLDRLADYEALSQGLFARKPAAVLCLYNRMRFSEAALRDAVMTRPDVAADSELAGNPDYAPCDAFLARLKGAELSAASPARNGRPSPSKGSAATPAASSPTSRARA